MPTKDDKLWKKLKKLDMTTCKHTYRTQYLTNTAVTVKCYGKKWYHVEWYKLCSICLKKRKNEMKNK